MKALLIGSFLAVLAIICGAITVMVIDSSNTIDAQVISKATKSAVSNVAGAAESDGTVNSVSDGIAQSVSAKEALEELKSHDIPELAGDSSKTGYTIEYQAKQSACSGLIEIKEDAFSQAEDEFKDAEEDYEAALGRADDLEDTGDSEAIEDAQERIREQKEIMDKAEKVLFNAREELIKARTTCQS